MRATSTPAADRIYAVAEARVEQGAYGEAALLLRHALLQLPADASGDELRHKLVLRIAYVEMLAWSASGSRVHLEDAERMLQRYLERHEALFGVTQTARDQRGDVYEILYEVERRLEESPPVGDSTTIAHASVSPVDSIPVDAPSPDSAVPFDSEASARPTKRAESSRAKAPRQTGVSPEHGDDDGDVRVVRVRNRARPDVNDPAVRKRMKSAFTNPEAAMVLTGARWVAIEGPRPLVRLATAASAVEANAAEDRRLARSLGRSLVRAARPELRRCYAEAFARQPVTSTETVVELSVNEDGSVSGVRIVDGGLVDGLGDVCVIERLGAAQVDAPPELVASHRVRLPLEFVYQDTQWFLEPPSEAPRNQTTAQETILVGPRLIQEARGRLGLSP